MASYFTSPDGLGYMQVSDGPFAAQSIPDGWHEATVEEYEQAVDAARQAADEAAAKFLANDGDVEPGDGEVLPLAELRESLKRS